MRAQISVFIVIGLVILVIAGISFAVVDYVNSGLDNELLAQYRVQSDIEPVKKYIESCLEQVSIEPIDQIGENGGSLEPGKFRWYFGNKFNYLCHGDRCEHNPLFRQEMEAELEYVIRDRLIECMDLSIFERQDFTVRTGVMDLNATIGRKDVSIKLYYPVQLMRADLDLKISDYNVRIKKPLGLLYDKSIEIINSEIQNSYFDQVEYIVNNDKEVIVEKHRPYPDIVYELTSDEYLFRFALEGVHTQPGYMDTSTEHGCCYNLYDKACFQNTPASQCEAKGGIYDFNTNCVCPATDDTGIQTCQGFECNGCNSYDYVKDSYTGEPRQHGESWCTYEGKVGRGYDYVGSRHYMHYCIDGVEYVEECRDFREELCTEETNNISKAVCRENRWEDCSSCTTQQCCEDLNFRDCHWKDWLLTQSKCVPYVPPGFRFWEYSGVEICSNAIETKKCDGISCPNVWVDDTAMLCYMQGDCGNYRNVNDVISHGGFFNSDIQDKVRDYVYLEDGLIDKGNEYSIDLGINNRGTTNLWNRPVYAAQDNLIRLINIGLNYVDSLTSITFTDMLQAPYGVRIMDIALCDVWHAPWGSADCENCGSPLRPCTEYKCKSIGTQCGYKEEEGFPLCYVRSEDNEFPVVSVDSDSLQEGFDLEATTLTIHDKSYNGYEITPMVEPYKIFTLGINTSEETICRLKYLPRTRFLKFPSYYFGEARFSTYHNISLRMPARIEIPHKVMDFLNITNLVDFLDELQKPKQLYEKYRNKYDGEIDMFETVSGKDFDKLAKPYIDKAFLLLDQVADLLPFYKALLEMLIHSFEEGRSYLFVVCSDFSGNINKEEIFVTFQIDDLSNDVTAPKILGFKPQNNSAVRAGTVDQLVYMYVNEPAECRYDTEDIDIDDMTAEFSCPVSRYRTVPEFGGSYECNTVLPNMTIYIRCRDNPSQIFTYEFSMAQGSGKVIGLDSKFVNVTGSDIYAPAVSLTEDVLFIAPERFKFHLYVNERLNCTFNINETQYPFTCAWNDDLQIGLYECVSDARMIKNPANASFDLHLVYGPPRSTGKTVNLTYANQDVVAIYHKEKSINLELNLDNWHNCYYNTSPMKCLHKNDTVCYAGLDINKTYKIQCWEYDAGFNAKIECEVPRINNQNTNHKGVKYTLKTSDDLQILTSGPEGERDLPAAVLFTETNHPARCGYYKDFMLGTIMMDNTTSTLHEAIVNAKAGIHYYYIICRDEFGNEARDEIEFYVVE